MSVVTVALEFIRRRLVDNATDLWFQADTTLNGVVFGEVIVIAVLLALAMTPFFVLRRRLPCRAHYIALGVMAVCLIESLVWIPHRDVQVEEYLPREVA